MDRSIRWRILAQESFVDESRVVVSTSGDAEPRIWPKEE